MDILHLGVQQGLFILSFIIPGYVMLRTVSMTISTDYGDHVRLLIRCVLLSAINYVVAGPLLLAASSRGYLDAPAGILVFGTLSVLVLPTLLAVLYVYIMLRLQVPRWIFERILHLPYNYPISSAWDAVFRSREFDFVRVTLKSGTRLAGFFGQKSLAPDFPRDRDLFIEQAWRMDEYGNPVGEIEDNRGVYVAPGEISVIEFLRGRQ